MHTLIHKPREYPSYQLTIACMRLTPMHVQAYTHQQHMHASHTQHANRHTLTHKVCSHHLSPTHKPHKQKKLHTPSLTYTLLTKHVHTHTTDTTGTLVRATLPPPLTPQIRQWATPMITPALPSAPSQHLWSPAPSTTNQTPPCSW